MAKNTEPAPPGYEYIFRKTARHPKTGKLIVAKSGKMLRLLVKAA